MVVLHRADGEPCIFDPSWKTPYTVRVWENMEKNLITGIHDLHYDMYLEAGTMRETRSKYVCWFVNRDSRNKEAVQSLMNDHHFMPPDTQTMLRH